MFHLNMSWSLQFCAGVTFRNVKSSLGLCKVQMICNLLRHLDSSAIVILCHQFDESHVTYSQLWLFCIHEEWFQCFQHYSVCISKICVRFTHDAYKKPSGRSRNAGHWQIHWYKWSGCRFIHCFIHGSHVLVTVQYTTLLISVNIKKIKLWYYSAMCVCVYYSSTAFVCLKIMWNETFTFFETL